MSVGIYSYEKACEKINEKLFASEAISIRTLRFWVKEGLVTPPIGKGKKRKFQKISINESVAVRKLQSRFEQSNSEIEGLMRIATDQAINHHCPISVLVDALENGRYQVEGIEALKNGDLILLEDEAFNEGYKLAAKEEDETLYIKEGSDIFKRVEKIKEEDGKLLYFDLENFEECFKQDPLMYEYYKLQDVKEIKLYAENGILPKPFFRYKGKNYYSEENLHTGWSLSILGENLSIKELKELRKKIEADLEKHPNALEKHTFSPSSFRQEFRKRNELFDNIVTFLWRYFLDCEKSLKNHTEETSKKLLREYIAGYWFICVGDSEFYEFAKTPIKDLSPQQIKQGLEEGRFTKKQVEKILKAKASEVEALKKILK